MNTLMSFQTLTGGTMGTLSTALAATDTDAAKVAADQAQLAADQAAMTTDDAAAYAELAAAPYNGTALNVVTNADGSFSYFVVTAVPPTSFTQTQIQPA